MLQRTIPGTDISISVVGFGCWAIGKQYWGDDVEDDVSTQAIHAALDEGINWFDTAPLYGGGHADTVLAQALGTRKNDVVIATKVGVRLGEDGQHAQSDLSAKWIIEDTEASLSRLGLECIDLLQVHWPCEFDSDFDTTMRTLEDLRQSGKIRYFGLCNYEADDVLRAKTHPGMVSLQTPYSLLRREFEGALQGSCTTDKTLAVLAYEPLCRGLLSGKFRTQPNFPETDLRSWDERFQGNRFTHAQKLVSNLEQVGQKLGIPTAAIAVGWAIAQPGITAAIVGAKNPDQVRQNARSAELLQKPKALRIIDQIAAIHGGWPK
jgi:aryl-alcohol dehydrogenase-like predicted oxidoreductase